jgi:hypothetical protein
MNAASSSLDYGPHCRDDQSGRVRSAAIDGWGEIIMALTAVTGPNQRLPHDRSRASGKQHSHPDLCREKR